MSRRILDETTASTLNSDDYLYVDGVTDGARKITADNVVRGTSVAQQLAQHIADAEEEVEQITDDIEGIQSDISDVKNDIGDLDDLETTDKASLVGAINEAAKGADTEAVNALIEAYITEHHIEGVTDAEIQEMVDTYLESGSVENAVNDWLTAHPEATTTVQDGTITESKLSTALLKTIKSSGNESPLIKTSVVGEIFEKTKPYTTWSLGNIQYDPYIDKVVFLVNSKPAHMTGCNIVEMRTIDPSTMEVSDPIALTTTVDVDGTDYGQITNTFLIREDGTYLFVTKVHSPSHPDTVSEYRLYKSVDHGETWTYTIIPCPFTSWYGGFNTMRELANGRLITCGQTTSATTVFKSDDDGATWTYTTIGNTSGSLEGCIIELEPNELMCIIRANMSGYTTRVPAKISYSHDNGNTWSSAINSTSITDMTASPCSAVVDGNFVELVYTSRFINGDYNGTVYKQYATIDDAKTDNFSQPYVVVYADASTGQDFGYAAMCKDGYGKYWILYYDQDVTGTNYRLVVGSRKGAIDIPVNDSMITGGNAYSSEKIESMFTAMTTKVKAWIMAINGGVEPSDYVVVNDGLFAHLDALNADNFESKTLNDLVSENTATVNSSMVWDENGIKGSATSQFINAKYINTSLDNPQEFSVELTLNNSCSNTNPAALSISAATNAGQAAAAQLLRTGRHVIYYTNSEESATTVNDTSVSISTTDIGLVHYVRTFSQTDRVIKTYKNGLLISQYALPSAFVSFNNYFYSGGNIWIMPYNANNDCAFVSFRVYTKVLSADEVKNNYDYEANRQQS